MTYDEVMVRFCVPVVMVLTFALSGCADEIRRACQDLIVDRMSEMTAAEAKSLNSHDLKRICPGASPAQRERAYRDALSTRQPQ